MIVYLKKSVLKHKGMLLIILTFNLVAAMASIVQPVAFQLLFDGALLTGDYRGAVWLVAGIVVIPIFFAAVNSVTIYFSSKLGNVLARDIRSQMFKRVLRAKPGAISNGEIINRITQQVGLLCEVFLVGTVMKLVMNVMMLVVTVVVMGAMNVHLTLIALVAFPVFMGLVKVLRKKARHLDEEYFKLLDQAINYLQDLFANMKSVHIFNGYNKEDRHFNEWLDEQWVLKQKVTVFHDTYASVLSEVALATITGVIYAYSLFLLMEERLTVGTMLAFIIILPRLYSIFKDLFLSQIDVYRMKAVVNNLDEVLNLDVVSDGDKVLAQEENHDLQLRDVGFQYEGSGDEGLKNVSFDVKFGSFVGIVGVSGSGKSTLFDLIHRHLDPIEGGVLLNGVDVREYKLESLRDYIGYNPQKLGLWNTTVFENIIYPLERRALTTKQLEAFEEAVRWARVDGFVRDLPEGYETIVQNQGANFSGGEIQRLLLARTLFHQSKIILLDEYTSALDALTEEYLNEMFLELVGKKTLLVIAHRLSTIKQAQKILVVDKGEIIESGTVTELLEQQGVFYKMYQAQVI